MQYVSDYDSPLGKILIASDDIGLTGLWFYDQKYFPATLSPTRTTNKIISDTKNWLDIYFCTTPPDYTPPLHPSGTEFQQRVWAVLQTIPYGHTTTYGEIANTIASHRLARAVGMAIGHNPISIIIPCHRVIGTNNKITGYAGGIDKKIKLLQLENPHSYLSPTT